MSFALEAGQALGIIGPSASGKSSVVKALLGIWPTTFGKVRIDGAEVSQWSPDELGRHLGYLPQEVSLCDGTVAENIATLRNRRLIRSHHRRSESRWRA